MYMEGNRFEQIEEVKTNCCSQQGCQVEQNETNRSTSAKDSKYYEAYYQSMRKNQINGLGIAGFVLSIIGLVFLILPPIGFIMLIVALGLSIAGLTKPNKGFAIAGLIISTASIVIAVTLLLLFIGAYEEMRTNGGNILDYMLDFIA